jgi:hypothetical protein
VIETQLRRIAELLDPDCHGFYTNTVAVIGRRVHPTR